MTAAELKQLYNDDPDFKRYVEECQKADGRSLEGELELSIVRLVAEFYKERKGNIQN